MMNSKTVLVPNFTATHIYLDFVHFISLIEHSANEKKKKFICYCIFLLKFIIKVSEPLWCYILTWACNASAILFFYYFEACSMPHIRLLCAASFACFYASCILTMMVLVHQHCTTLRCVRTRFVAFVIRSFKW